MNRTFPRPTRPGRRNPLHGALALLFAAALGLTACGGDSSTAPSLGPAGTYDLQQIDQSAPPVEIHHGPWFDAANHHFYNQLIIQITGGTLEMNDDNTFTLTFDVSAVGDGKAGNGSSSIDGTYVVNGSNIRLDSNGGSVAGTLQHGVLTVGIDFMNKGKILQYSFRR